MDLDPPTTPSASFNTASSDVSLPIDGVVVRRLVWHNDQRGSLSELVRTDDDAMMPVGIGQVYATTLVPGVVKAWHLHKRQWDRMSCVTGRVMLVLIDDRDDSPTRGAVVELVLGDRNHICVLVPPGVFHGLKNIGMAEAVVVNVVSEPHDRAAPDEFRVAAHGILDYDWTRHDR